MGKPLITKYRDTVVFDHSGGDYEEEVGRNVVEMVKYPQRCGELSAKGRGCGGGIARRRVARHEARHVIGAIS